jgi:hypothetical protein
MQFSLLYISQLLNSFTLMFLSKDLVESAFIKVSVISWECKQIWQIEGMVKVEVNSWLEVHQWPWSNINLLALNIIDQMR